MSVRDNAYSCATEAHFEGNSEEQQKGESGGIIFHKIPSFSR